MRMYLHIHTNMYIGMYVRSLCIQYLLVNLVRFCMFFFVWSNCYGKFGIMKIMQFIELSNEVI